MIKSPVKLNRHYLKGGKDIIYQKKGIYFVVNRYLVK